jgi:hypothetical protein
MSFPDVTDIATTTLENRGTKIRNNVENNNAILKYMRKSGNIRTFSGGRLIYEPLDFAENGNAAWYSGFDQLGVAAQDVISSAEFSIKQCAVPVVISGLEQLQNDGREAIIDLLAGRIQTAERTMANLVATGLYSDGTGSGSKQIVGLDAAVPVDPSTGTYGGINRANWTFWCSKKWTTDGDNSTTAATTSTIQGLFNTFWAGLVRGTDHPNLILMGSTIWGTYMGSLQTLQRFTSPGTAELGFETLKYLQADVVLDGGIGGAANTNTAYFLPPDYLHFRPHAKRNFVPLSPSRRFAINQDAEVAILAFAGAMTCSGARFQGRFKNATAAS